MKSVSIPVLAGMVACAFVLPVSAAESARYTEKVLWSFGSGTDGMEPVAGLLDVKGTLYGTTEGGGSGIYDSGTVFALDPNTGAETVLYSFCSRQNCADGGGPGGDLIAVKGTLYGTTEGGGAEEEGTVFSLDPATGAETVVHSFAGGNDGEEPFAGLIDVKGTFYGTTYFGGASRGGTVFALDPNTGAETVLYSFCAQQNCTDGAEPTAAVIDPKGILYGTTSAGGAETDGCYESSCGEVFSVDPKTGKETVLHSFGSGTDGFNPYAGLVDVNGTLYGTTNDGGDHTNNLCEALLGGSSCGVVFALDPKTGKEKVIYSFCSRTNCTDGANPVAGLIDVNGILYGTTYYGGNTNCNNLGCGTVFSIDPRTGTEKVLYAFAGGTDGAHPYAGLIDVKGSLYGTTIKGGAYGWGTVFALAKNN